MNRELLKEILHTQKTDLIKNQEQHFIARDINLMPHLGEKEITIITGVRKSGKSSLLEQFFIKQNLIDKLLYVSFEDPQLLEFEERDFVTLYELWIEKNGEDAQRIAYFDEVQNVEGWERWMNFFAKQKGFKVFVTGSYSNLLSSEFTGKHRSLTIFPLSFREIVADLSDQFKIESIVKGNISEEERLKLVQVLSQYMDIGGFPTAWTQKSTTILSEYYSNILNRDILKRKKVRNSFAIDKIGLSLMSDIGRKISKAKLATLVGLKDADTVESYISYFEECFLGFQIRKYDSSVRTQQWSQVKFYSIDSALARRVVMLSDSTSTYHFENLIYLELLRRGSKVYYWQSDKGEIDFFVETKNGERILIQVCWDLNNKEAEKREIFAFDNFIALNKNLKIHGKYIITMEGGKRTINSDIRVIPFYLWALDLNLIC